MLVLRRSPRRAHRVEKRDMALDEKVSVAVASFRAVHRAHRRERLPVLSSSSVGVALK